MLEHQLKGEVGLEDVHWVINVQTGDDCICLYDFTKKANTLHSFLHQTVELADRIHNPLNVNYRKAKKRERKV